MECCFNFEIKRDPDDLFAEISNNPKTVAESFETEKDAEMRKIAKNRGRKALDVNKKVPVGCRICDKKIYKISYYEKHWEVVHKYVHPSEMYDNPQQCEICKRYLQNKHSLQSHVSAAHKKQFNFDNNDNHGITLPDVSHQRSCHMCALVFDDYHELKLHVKKIHKETHNTNIQPSNASSACIAAIEVIGEGEVETNSSNNVLEQHGRIPCATQEQLELNQTFDTANTSNIYRTFSDLLESKNHFSLKIKKDPDDLPLSSNDSNPIVEKFETAKGKAATSDMSNNSNPAAEHFKPDKSNAAINDLRKIATSRNREVSEINKKVPIGCRICDKKMFKISYYEKHWELAHKDIHPSEMYENPQQCDICKRYLQNKHSLQSHVSAVHKTQLDFTNHDNYLFTSPAVRNQQLCGLSALAAERYDKLKLNLKNTRSEIHSTNIQLSNAYSMCHAAREVMGQNELQANSSSTVLEPYRTPSTKNEQLNLHQCCDKSYLYKTLSDLADSKNCFNIEMKKDQEDSFAFSYNSTPIADNFETNKNAMISNLKKPATTRGRKASEMCKKVPIGCRICDKNIFKISYYEKHWEAAHKHVHLQQMYENPHQCQICHRYLQNKHSLQSHMSAVHKNHLDLADNNNHRFTSPVDDHKRSCHICGLVTYDYYELKLHLKKIHKGMHNSNSRPSNATSSGTATIEVIGHDESEASSANIVLEPQ